jgi:streptogramin lyase
MPKLKIVVSLATLSTSLAAATAPAPGLFQDLGTYRAPGGSFASTVAPGPRGGPDRLYATHIYVSGSLEVTSVDPSTGQVTVYPNPARTEYGARCMVTGPDGNVYIGTLPGAHLLKLETRSGTLADLGRPSPTEQYIWSMAFGSDENLYAGTYPGARLVRYNRARGTVEDLGRLDPVEQYARYLATSNDGFVYVGIGTSRMNIAAYHIATGQSREILPAAYQAVGTVQVYKGADGNVYGLAGKNAFRMQGWKAVPIDPKSPAGFVTTNRTRDSLVLALRDRTLVITDTRTGRVIERDYAYQGHELAVFRVGVGPDGHLYASSVLPGRLLRLEDDHGRIHDLGPLGGGEVYTFLSRHGRLLMGAYSLGGPLLVFDPAHPVSAVPAALNPTPIGSSVIDESWRPQAMTLGPGGKVYVGGIPGYGKLGGPLYAWDVDKGSVIGADLVARQAVSALALWHDWIVAGTTVRGGEGSHPSETTVRIVVWNPSTKEVEFDLAPIAHADAIENLAVAPNGKVYAIAAHKLIVLDMTSRALTIRPLPFTASTLWSSFGLGPDGRLWGLAAGAEGGIFAVDPSTNDIALVARPPSPITAGFAIVGGNLYFASGAELYRYVIPAPGRAPRRHPQP